MGMGWVLLGYERYGKREGFEWGEKGRRESNGFGQQGIRFDQDGEGYGDVGVDGN